ncbi:MAG: HEAT repeat domain-containing protein [Planctomycetota bacterium]|jgi:HEAT repeat protein
MAISTRKRVVVRFFTVFSLMVSLLLTAGAADALADDEDISLTDRVKALEDEIDGHRRDKAIEALVDDITAAHELFTEAGEGEVTRESEAAQKRLVKMVGSLTKMRDDTVATAAVVTLGEIGHEAGARYLKSFLRPVDTRDAEPVVREAIQAAAKIGDDSLVVPLLNMVERSDNYAIAATAMRALGKFGDSRRYRRRILESLVKSVQKNQPGGRPRYKPNQVKPEAPVGRNYGTGAQARWQALAPVLPEVLNELTGQRFASASDWFDVTRENKRNLNVLFSDDA